MTGILGGMVAKKMEMMMRLMNLVLPTCEEVSRLASIAMDESLPLGKRIGLRLHLGMCVWCRRNAGQLQLMRRLSRCSIHDHGEGPWLSDEARDRMARALEEEGRQSPDA